MINRPTLPHVTLEPGRVRRRTGLPCTLHWASVPALDDVTTPLRTVLDCLRTLTLAEALEHHGTRRALVKDCRRQVNLAIRGWSILRFSWEDVMFDGEWVMSAVEQATGLQPLTKRVLRAA
ncbi:hypothetical protein AB0L70_00955 [Kribbella sp. NPDC051952]|uniref:hypothetical protein n=1 Tax=Kribbella sp. NPDC051952 TaxID=3154851 RepID=UPI00344788DA